jgi:hypothetical protein
MILDPEHMSTRMRVYGAAVGAAGVAGSAYFLKCWLDTTQGGFPGFDPIVATWYYNIFQFSRFAVDAAVGRHIHVFTPTYHGLKALASKSYGAASSTISTIKEWTNGKKKENNPDSTSYAKALYGISDI